MIRYIIKRLMFVITGLLIISFAIFCGIRFAPGDPADIMIPGTTTAGEREAIHKKLGLDKPVIIQYYLYLKKIITKGDFGESYYSPEPVTKLLIDRIPASVQLVGFTFTIILFVGIPTGFLAAIYRNSIFDNIINGTIYFLQALPDFWVAIVLIMLFSLKFEIFPPFGRGGIETMILPSVALALPLIGRTTRFVRNGLLEVLQEEYIKTGFSKGASKFRVYVFHAFRNSLIPLVTDTSLQFVWTIGNAIVIEEIFAWSGIGRFVISSLRVRDYPAIQACVLFFALVFMIVNLIIDLIYTKLDPRIRYE